MASLPPTRQSSGAARSNSPTGSLPHEAGLILIHLTDLADREEKECPLSAIASPRSPWNPVAGSRQPGSKGGTICPESATDPVAFMKIPENGLCRVGSPCDSGRNQNEPKPMKPTTDPHDGVGEVAPPFFNQ